MSLKARAYELNLTQITKYNRLDCLAPLNFSTFQEEGTLPALSTFAYQKWLPWHGISEVVSSVTCPSLFPKMIHKGYTFSLQNKTNQKIKHTFL